MSHANLTLRGAARVLFFVLCSTLTVPAFVASGAGAVLGPAPANLQIAVAGGHVQLTWDSPDPASGNTRVVVLRRLNVPPTAPDDEWADYLFGGTATQFVHRIDQLLPDTGDIPRAYHYAVFGCNAAGTVCEDNGTRASLAPTLAQCLRGGGYTFFWRHADAEVCADRTDLGTAATTTVPGWWRSCDADCQTATAQQLNAAGVTHAIAIGQALDAMQVPFGRVIASEYCRCIQTAELMDLGPVIETDAGLSYYVYDESSRCTHCYERIREVPVIGANTAIIGHAEFSPSCPVLSSLAWGECAVFKPFWDDSSTFILRVTWDGWAALPIAAPEVPAMAGSPIALAPTFEAMDGVWIRYRTSAQMVDPIAIDVFDLRGRSVWSLAQAPQAPGVHELLWNRRDRSGQHVARGVYLLRLSAGGHALTTKALVLRP